MTHRSMKPYIIALAGMALAMPISSQTLTKEITVDKEIVPDLRDSRRLTVNPSVVKPSIEQSTLTVSERAVATEVPTMIERLEPAVTESGDTLTRKQRGYAALGYFPTYNLGASAGYRFIDSDRTRLNGWMQYDGTSFETKNRYNDKYKWERHTVTAAALFSHQLNDNSSVSAGVNYTFAEHNPIQWYDTADKDKNQRVNRFTIAAGYAGHTSGIEYSATLSGGMTAFGSDGSDVLWMAAPESRGESVSLWSIKPLGHTTESDYGLKGAVGFGLGDGQKAGLRLDTRLNHYNKFNSVRFVIGRGYEGYMEGAKTIGALCLNPYWELTVLRDMKLEAGANVDFSINSGKSMMISPECSLTWAPSGDLNLIAMGLHATGGIHSNTLGSLLDYTPYVFPGAAYRNSRVPIDMGGVITVGPFSGGYLELSADYAHAKDWLMPDVILEQNLWQGYDLKGWLLSAKIGYSFSDIVEISAKYSQAPGKSFEKCYYQWLDRARQAVNATLTVRPIKQLTIDVDFEGRWDRRTIDGRYSELAGMGSPVYWVYNLGAVRNLSAGALYKFNDRWSVFARCEGIVFSDYYMLWRIPAQPFHGLVGATVRF